MQEESFIALCSAENSARHDDDSIGGTDRYVQAKPDFEENIKKEGALDLDKPAFLQN